MTLNYTIKLIVISINESLVIVLKLNKSINRVHGSDSQIFLYCQLRRFIILLKHLSLTISNTIRISNKLEATLLEPKESNLISLRREVSKYRLRYERKIYVL